VKPPAAATISPNVNGALYREDRCYYLDPGRQPETQLCLDAVEARQFLLLPGARVSGKTTQLFWLRNHLNENGYEALYVSFEGVTSKAGAEVFWTTFGRSLRNAAHARGFINFESGRFSGHFRIP